MQVQEGRARAYALLADLVARGVTAENLEATGASPLLAQGMAEYPPSDLDAVAVDHQHVLGFSVALFEGVYLDETFSWGGRFAVSCSDAYRAMGWSVEPRADEPEHLSSQLRALAFLSGAEADACEDGREDMAQRTRTLAREFLDDHLLRWLPAFTSAVRRSGRPFVTALAEQVQELVLMHRAALGPMVASEPFVLASPGLSLDDKETGLDDIAGYLATPGRSGVYLSRDDLAGLGRATQVPRGFGERVVTLQNLLRSASHLGALDAVLDALSQWVAAWGAELEPERWATTPSLAPLIEPWRARAAETGAMLQQIRLAHAEGQSLGGDL